MCGAILPLDTMIGCSWHESLHLSITSILKSQQSSRSDSGVNDSVSLYWIGAKSISTSLIFLSVDFTARLQFCLILRNRNSPPAHPYGYARLLSWIIPYRLVFLSVCFCHLPVLLRGRVFSNFCSSDRRTREATTHGFA